MMIAKLEGTIVVDVIIATLDEANEAFPESNWVECPQWIGIGMDINSPEPTPLEKTNTSNQPQPVTTGTTTL
jgi:hypothetical protein